MTYSYFIGVICIIFLQFKFSFQRNLDNKRENVPVLSGTAIVGQLYDGSRDQIIEGFSLWKKELMNVTESNVLSTSTEMNLENNINDRLNSMDITASLKLSFLGGLISVEGKVRYLQDEKHSTNVIRAVYKYTYTGIQR